MFRLIRVRLALSYAGIALLVTIALGAVLLVRLRAYYASMELGYLYSNAKAISAMAAPMLAQRPPREVQEAQVNNLAFLSQTHVRILDTQQHVLADSGPWLATKLDLGMVAKFQGNISGNGAGPNPPSSVIVIRRELANPGSFSETVTASSGKNNTLIGPIEEKSTIKGPAETSRAFSVPGLPVKGQQDIFFFGPSVQVSNSVYGLSLSSKPAAFGARSDQMVQEPILDSLGHLLGYVELSESPAYGREIVNSVASGLAVAGGLAILLAIGVGWLTSRRFTEPLLRLTQATQQMSGGDLTVRVAEASRGDEFGALGKSFNQMAGRIEETVQTLRRFLADAAHELQTPLTALRTNLELAKSEGSRVATEEYLTQALEQTARLQQMMADLISLSRLEGANGQDAFQPVDLSALAQQVSEPFAARAEQAGQSFELRLSAAGPLVMGSPEKLRSALSNLLDNALKFTPSGGAIALHLYESQNSLCLAVSDTGIGIPPDEIEMLYNRFHRGRNASAYPGSGLGLAIVRAIAGAHGGSIQAANNPGGGATFTLCLPRLAEQQG